MRFAYGFGLRACLAELGKGSSDVEMVIEPPTMEKAGGNASRHGFVKNVWQVKDLSLTSSPCQWAFWRFGTVSALAGLGFAARGLCKVL